MYSILTWDNARQQLAERSSSCETAKQDHWHRLRSRTTAFRTPDPERGVADGIEARPAASQQPGGDLPKLNSEDLDMFKLLQGTYNYTTIDHGPDCMCCSHRQKRHRHCSALTIPKVICIGANWLHERPKQLLSPELGRIYEASAELVPPKHWAWYILTSDREPSTVPRWNLTDEGRYCHIDSRRPCLSRDPEGYQNRSSETAKG